MSAFDGEDRLRRSLAERAGDAPPGAPLAERIITSIGDPGRIVPIRRARSWTSWGLPLLAAAAVAAVVLGVLGALNLRPSPNHPVALNSPTVSNTVTPTSPRSSPKPSPSRAATSSPQTSQDFSTSASTQVVVPPPTNAVGLNAFRASDLTFVSDTDGWALGTADCLGKTGRCSALVRTTDGTHWTANSTHFTTPFTVSGSSCSDCVSHIRFATSSIGYAYGPDALFLTLDGGQSWAQQSGGAYALETFDETVIRVSSTPGCPMPDCTFAVRMSAPGSTAWKSVALPAVSDGNTVTLSRSGADAYLLIGRNNETAETTRPLELFVSADDGASWVARPNARTCGIDPHDVLAQSVAAAPGGRSSVLCFSKRSQRSYVLVSGNLAQRLARAGTLPRSGGGVIVGDPAGALFVGGAGVYRSTDGGARWQRSSVAGYVTFLGFESATVGRAVTDGGRTIWTTTDAGASWSSFTFPG